MFTNIKDKLTIVIPTYNEEKYIERTIMSIVQQNNVKGLRVIVSDGFSTDNIREIVNNLKELFKEMKWGVVSSTIVELSKQLDK